MQWKSLEKKIKYACREHKKNSDYVDAYVRYAKNLYSRNLPLISTPRQLANLIGIDYDCVCKMAYAQKRFYRHFVIQKKSGGFRDISEPLPDLKFVQDWILTHILEKVPVSAYAKAFVKKRNLKQNARFHIGQKAVVTLDIKNFFPSISIFDVFNIFHDMGYLDNVAWFMANLCCYDKCLPQGTSTSPYLSNLRMRKFDEWVAENIIRDGIRYTRYADDLTFSGDFNPHLLIKKVSERVHLEGFNINSEKTRVAYGNTRQEVTGIVVNEKMQAPRSLRRKIRQEVYYIRKFGLDSHLKKQEEMRAHYVNHLLGKINFACFANPADLEMKEYFQYVRSILVSSEDDDR